MTNLTNELQSIYQAHKQIVSMTIADRSENIRRKSPYSQRINKYIRSDNELSIYLNLGLCETFLTRPALILDIDPNFRLPNGETNLQRMLRGRSPYDVTTNTVIDLHHIGQQYTSPFAELPHSIHDAPGTNGRLHPIQKASWRSDSALVAKYHKEAEEHWRAHAEILQSLPSQTCENARRNNFERKY